MSCWDVLGISPTANQKEIRQAYAIKSKECHPEENAEAFQALYSAYQAALSSAKNGVQSEIAPPQTEELFRHEILNSEDSAASKTEKKFDFVFQKKTHNEEPSQPPQPEQEILVDSMNSYKQIQDTHWGQMEERIKNLKEGALYSFMLIFENPKTCSDKKKWQEFFLSDIFLLEQYDDFLFYLPIYLKMQQAPKEIPKALITELFIAFELDKPKSVQEIGESAEELLRILEDQHWFAYAVKDLNKQENAEKQSAFQRYRELLFKYETGYFDQSHNAADYWQIFVSNFVSPTFFRLLATFINNHKDLPESLCLFLMDYYKLQNIGNSSSKPFLLLLQQAILSVLGDSYFEKLEDQNKERENLQAVTFGLAALVKQQIAKGNLTTKDIDDLFHSASFLSVQYSQALLTHLEVYFQIHTRVPLPIVFAALDSYQSGNIHKESKTLLDILQRYEKTIYNGTDYIDDDGY